MTTTTLPGVLLTGNHASRPAATAVGSGTLYACSTHALIYQSDGATWSTWATLGTGTSTTTIANDTIWAAKGDIVGATGNDAAAVLTVGANDTILMADSAATNGLKWVASATPSTQAFGDSAAVGTGDTFTRGDHKHAMPAAAITTSGLTIATARLAGRGSASTGAVEEITVGTGLLLSGTTLSATGAAGSITTASAECSADVSLTANTMADATGCSVSLVAGTWIVWGSMTFVSNASAGYCLVYLRDGGNADYASGRAYMSAGKYLTVPVGPKVVTPGSTTTFKLSGQAENTLDAIKQYANGTVPATMMSAVKIA